MKTRILGSPDGASCYHVMSRTVSDEEGGMMFFGEDEKNVFAAQLRKHAGFAGVEVLTWCMMDNHFHLLVRVPAREEFVSELLANGREKFWQQMRFLYSRIQVKSIRDEIESLEQAGGMENHVEEILSQFTRRMADLSSFVQGLKFAFSVWFNRERNREGTLWMRRFKSVLLEGDSAVLNKVAAYIDLNPVRAGLVADPGQYRWSGYGQALGGIVVARRGLSVVYGYQRNEWRQISEAYRQLLLSEGVEARDGEGKFVRSGVGGARVDESKERRGHQGDIKRLAKPVRYFSDGAAVGSREFLESVFERNRSMFGSNRKTGARKFRGPAWKGAGLFSLRDLGRE